MENRYETFVNKYYLEKEPRTQIGQQTSHAPYDKYSRFGMKDPKFDLKSYQNIAVNRITNYCDNKGIILMHGVGSGKTLTSLTIALNSLELIHKTDNSPNIIVIVHPTGLYSQFHNEIVTKLPGISECTTQEKDQASESEKKLQARFRLNVKDESVNFYNFSFFHNERREVSHRRIIIISKIYKNFKESLKVPDGCISLRNELRNTVIIFDEAHRLLRPIVPGIPATMIGQLLDYKVATTCKKLIVMSGTPILESISDIFLLLRFVTEFEGVELSKNNVDFKNNVGQEVKLYNFNLNEPEIHKYFLHSEQYSNFLNKVGWNKNYDQWQLVYGSFFNSEYWKYMNIANIDKLAKQKLEGEQINPLYEWLYSDALTDIKVQMEKGQTNNTKIEWYNQIREYLFKKNITIDKINTMDFIGKTVVEYLYPLNNDNYNNFPKEIIWDIKTIYRNPKEWLSNYNRVNGWFNKNKDVIVKYNKQNEILTDYHLQNIYKSMQGGKRNGKYTGGEKYVTNTNISTPLKRIGDLLKQAEKSTITYLWKQTIPQTDFNKLYNETTDYTTKNIIKGFIEQLELDEVISISKLLKAASNYISIIDVDQPDIVNNFMNSYAYDENVIQELKQMKTAYETTIKEKQTAQSAPTSVVPIPTIEITVPPPPPPSDTQVQYNIDNDQIRRIFKNNNYTLDDQVYTNIKDVVIGSITESLRQNSLRQNSEYLRYLTCIREYQDNNNETIEEYIANNCNIIINIIDLDTEVFKSYEPNTDNTDSIYILIAKKQNEANTIYKKIKIYDDLYILPIRGLNKRKKSELYKKIKNISEIATEGEQTIQEGGRAPTSKIDPGLSSTSYEIIKEVYDQNNLINESPKELCNYPNKLINSVFIPYNNEQIYFKSVIEYSLHNKFKKAQHTKINMNCINHFPFCQWYLTDEEWGSWMNKCCSSYSTSVDYCSVKYNDTLHIYETNPFYDTNNEIDLTFSCPKFEKVFALLLLHKFGLSYNFETNETTVLPHLKSDNERYNSDMLNNGKHIIPVDDASKYYLPIVYSSSDLIGLNLFAAFLDNKLKLKPKDEDAINKWKNKPYLVLHDMDSKSHQGEIQKKSFGETYKIMKLPGDIKNIVKTIIKCLQLNIPIPSNLVNLFNIEFGLYKEPLCMLLHPLMTEGFDAKFNPSVILLDNAKTYSDFEQICGRVLRTYFPAYKECPNKMIYQFIGFNINNLKQLVDEYSGVPLEATSNEGALTITSKRGKFNYINNIADIEFKLDKNKNETPSDSSWMTWLYKWLDSSYKYGIEGTYDVSYKLRHDIYSVKLFFNELVMNSENYRKLIDSRERVQDKHLLTYMDETALFNIKSKDPNNPYIGKQLSWVDYITNQFSFFGRSFSVNSYIKEWSFYVPKYNLITCFDREHIINALSQKNIKVEGRIKEYNAKKNEYTIEYDNDSKTGKFSENDVTIDKIDKSKVFINMGHLLPSVYTKMYYSLIAAYTSVKGLQNNINVRINNGIFWRTQDDIVDDDYLNLDTQSEYTWIELLLFKIKKLENDLTDKWKNTENKLVSNYYLWKSRKAYVNYEDNLIEDNYDIDSMFLSLNAIEDLKLVNLLKMKLIDIYTNYYHTDDNIESNRYDVNIKILINSIPTLEEISYIKENKMNDELEQIIKIYHDEYTFKKFKDGLKRLDENDKILDKQVIPDLLGINKCVMKKPELKYKKWCDPLSINSSNMCSQKPNDLYNNVFTEVNKTKINNLLNLRKIKDMRENLDRYYEKKRDQTRITKLTRIIDFLTEDKKREISNLFMNKDITVEEFNQYITNFVIDNEILESIPIILEDIKKIELNLNNEEKEKKSQNVEKENENIDKFFTYIKNKDKSQGVYNNDGITIDYKDGSSYIGNIVSRMREGQGTMLYVNGDEYRGNWKFDMRDGKGKITFFNGDTCEGEWNKDKRKGKHKYIKSDGKEYYLHFDEDTITGSYADENSTVILNNFGQAAIGLWSARQRFKGGKRRTRKQKGGKKSKKYGKNKKHRKTKGKRTNKKTRKLQK